MHFIKRQKWEKIFFFSFSFFFLYRWSIKGKMQFKEYYLVSKCRRSDSAGEEIWKRWESESSLPGCAERPSVAGRCTESSPSRSLLHRRAGRYRTPNPQCLPPSIFPCSMTWQRRGHFSVPVKFPHAWVVISPKGIGKRRCCPKLSATIYSTYNHSISIFDFRFVALIFFFCFLTLSRESQNFLQQGIWPK